MAASTARDAAIAADKYCDDFRELKSVFRKFAILDPSEEVPDAKPAEAAEAATAADTATTAETPTGAELSAHERLKRKQSIRTMVHKSNDEMIAHARMKEEKAADLLASTAGKMVRSQLMGAFNMLGLFPSQKEAQVATDGDPDEELDFEQYCEAVQALKEVSPPSKNLEKTVRKALMAFADADGKLDMPALRQFLTESGEPLSAEELQLFEDDCCESEYEDSESDSDEDDGDGTEAAEPKSFVAVDGVAKHLLEDGLRVNTGFTPAYLRGVRLNQGRVEFIDSGKHRPRSAFSIAIWVKPACLDKRASIFAKMPNDKDPSTAGLGYQLTQTKSNALEFSINGGDKTVSLTTSAENSLKQHTWVHVLVACNLTETKMFFNGVQVQTDSSPEWPDKDSPGLTCKASLIFAAGPSFNDDMALGKDDREHFSGELCDFTVWNCAVDEATAMALSKSSKQFNGDERYLVTLLLPNQTITTGSRVGVPFHNAVVEVPDSVDLRSMQLTVSVWARPEETGMARRACILTKEPLEGPEAGYTISQRNSDRFWFYTGRAEKACTFTESRSKLKNGEWHHLVGTFDVSKKETRLYVNGKMEKIDPTVEWEEPTRSINSKAPFRVGLLTDGSDGFVGALCEICIWDTVLDEKAVKQLHEKVRVGANHPLEKNLVWLVMPTRRF